MTTPYEKVAGIVSHIRNARFGEMVRYSEELVESDAWRDFQSPIGTVFKFKPCEYDYFLAAMDIDPTTLRHAYAHAAPEDKLMRIADITGRGATPVNGDRRRRQEVAQQYAAEPSGAGARIEQWADKKLVTDSVARIARDPNRRRQAEAGQKQTRETRHVWRVRWSDDRTPAEAIVAKLLDDPELAHQVYNALEAERVRTRRSKRPSTDA